MFFIHKWFGEHLFVILPIVRVICARSSQIGTVFIVDKRLAAAATNGCKICQSYLYVQTFLVSQQASH